MSLKCAVQLGIPDIIHNHGKPITLSELVSALRIDQTKTNCIYRLMRMLVHSGFFATTKVDKDQEKEGYVLTPFSKILLKDKIDCLSPMVMTMVDPVVMTPWQCLGDWIQGTKQRPFESANGKSFWDYMDQDPEFKNLFHSAMESDSEFMNLVVKECKPVFEGLSSLVDVGGGTGIVARVISEAYPQLKCTLFDLPHVVANLPATASGNLNFVGGDLFQYIPSADAILMKVGKISHSIKFVTKSYLDPAKIYTIHIICKCLLNNFRSMKFYAILLPNLPLNAKKSLSTFPVTWTGSANCRFIHDKMTVLKD